jgi:lipopolysaccharide transport system ATP-binding protein
MSDVALRTVGLGKMYRIGAERDRYRTLRDALAQAAKRPLERLRHPGAATHISEELWALKDVDLEVSSGDVLGVIGRNGSGKSTLLKVLSHITEPTEGRAEIRGRVASLLEVGTGFHSELTGRENIQLNGAILGMTRAEIRSRFDDIVEFSEIGRFLDTPVKRYSSGMYVRLAFAVAAHLDPDILIVDEVLAVGDAEFQKKCLGRMGDIAHGGRTVVFVSHNMDAVRRLCSRAVWLDAGRVQLEAATGDCVVAYLERGGATSGGERVFSPPLAFQNGMPALLHAVRIFDEKGRIAERFSCASPLTIDIEWEATEALYRPRVGFIMRAGDGSDVLTALDATSWESKSRRPGLWTSSCSIPGGLLNEGEYTIDIGCDSPNRHDFGQGLTGGVLGFRLDDDMTIGSKYYGDEGFRDSRWPGVLLLDLPWTCVATSETTARRPSLGASATGVGSGAE